MVFAFAPRVTEVHVEVEAQNHRMIYGRLLCSFLLFRFQCKYVSRQLQCCYKLNVERELVLYMNIFPIMRICRYRVGSGYEL